MKLKLNRAKCRHCGDVLISEYRHDFKHCSCGTISVDGGLDYVKRSFAHSIPEDLIEMSIYESEPGEELERPHEED